MDWTFRVLVTRQPYMPRVVVVKQGIVETHPICMPADFETPVMKAVARVQSRHARPLSP